MYSGYPNRSSGAEFRDSIKTLDIKRLNHELSIRQTGMCNKDQRESAFQAKCLLIVEFAVVLFSYLPFFLGVGKKSATYAIIVFSPDLSIKISNFSKTVHTISIIFA